VLLSAQSSIGLQRQSNKTSYSDYDVLLPVLQPVAYLSTFLFWEEGDRVIITVRAGFIRIS